MAAITVRNLSDETHRALRHRAARHGRSTEAEVRVILDEATKPPHHLRAGDAMVEMFRDGGGVDLVIERDKNPSPPIDFG